MLIRVDQIVLRRRVRKDLGDLSSLMESMRTHGLMNPILVNKNKELIAGQRRLESAIRLGWKNVEVYIVDKEDELERLEMEVDENLQRRPLSVDELNDAFTKMEKLRNPSFLFRIFRAIARFFRSLFRRRSP
ncbi:MAG TPA: ParB N-terminal domain-containing protein [Spirochaetia bacterium]|nr:ParB N-terminal domain-containing protein [Spirochaetia bacterium]